MNLYKIISNFLAIFFIPFFLISCGTTQGNKLEKIKNNGEIVLGTSADYPPYEFPIIDNNGTERIIGFDILIAEEIAKDLGVNLRIKNLDFNGLLDALNSNVIDMTISGITPTEERKQSIDFSDIYYTAKNVVMTLKENENINSIEDLNGLIIGVQLSSIQDFIAHEKLKNSKIKSLIKIPDLFLELSSKKVHAIIVELPVAEQYLKMNPELSIINLHELNTDIDLGAAVGIKKGEPELLAEINKTISRLIRENKINEFFNASLTAAEELIEIRN